MMPAPLRLGSLCCAALVLVCWSGAGIRNARAVDISADFANIRNREYFVRIGIIQSTPAARIVPEGDFFLHDRNGAILYRGAAGTLLRLSCRDGAPARRVCYAVLGAFGPEQAEEAEALGSRAAAVLGARVGVRNDPSQDVTPSPSNGLPPRSPRLIVAAGPYRSSGEAQAARALLSRAGFSSSLLDCGETETRGRIEVRDAGGNLLAQAARYVGVWPRVRTTLIRATGAETLVGPTGPESADADPAYRGLIEIWINPRGEMSIMNRVFIEHYLYGVMPGEIGHTAPLEAKKAQAVVSRSAAIARLRQLSTHTGWHFDFCDEQHCQVYKGAHREDPDTNRAVDATMGQVCTYGDQIIDAVFSQSCGGITTNNEDVWEGDPLPYLRSRMDSFTRRGAPDVSDSESAERWIDSSPDVFCNPARGNLPGYATEGFRWTRTMTARELLRSLRASGEATGSRLVDLRIVRRTDSGRVAEVKAITNAGSFSIRNGLSIRRALGDLYSSLFVMHPSYAGGGLERVTFKGAGRGHGVGLCQQGAIAMAQRGCDYLTILRHYYSGIDIYRIYK